MKVTAGRQRLFVIDVDKLKKEDYVNVADLQSLLRFYARHIERTTLNQHERQGDVVELLMCVADTLPEMIKSVWSKPTKSALQEWGADHGKALSDEQKGD